MPQNPLTALINGIALALNPQWIDEDPKRTTETHRNTELNQSSWYYDNVKTAADRKGRCQEFDRMDEESPEISSVLDVYADNCVAGNMDKEKLVTYKVVTDNKNAELVFDMMEEQTGIKENIWEYARDTAKYGHVFEEIVVAVNKQIYDLKSVPPWSIIKKQNKWGQPLEKPFIQINDLGTKIAEFEPWQIMEFQMKGSRRHLYGRSIMNPIRRLYNQLLMLEDTLIVARLTRSHQRYAIGVDVGNLNGQAALDFVDNFKKWMTKKSVVDPATGRLKLQNNPLTAEEDIFIPVHEHSPANVTVLGGSGTLGQIEDLRYFHRKMFAALKVPKAYVGFEDDMTNRNVITALDIQFARNVRRLQTALVNGLQTLYDLTLTLNGMSPVDVRYQIIFPTLGTEDELVKWQIQQIRVNIASTLQGFGHTIPLSDRFIMKEYLGLSEEELDRMEASDEPHGNGVPGQDPNAVSNTGGIPPMEQSKTSPLSVERGGSGKYALTQEEIAILRKHIQARKDRELGEMIDNLRFLTDWKLETVAPLARRVRNGKNGVHSH